MNELTVLWCSVRGLCSARAVIVNTCYVNTCVCISIAVLWRRVTGFICFEMEGCVWLRARMSRAFWLFDVLVSESVSCFVETSIGLVVELVSCFIETSVGLVIEMENYLMYEEFVFRKIYVWSGPRYEPVRRDGPETSPPGEREWACDVILCVLQPPLLFFFNLLFRIQR